MYKIFYYHPIIQVHEYIIWRHISYIHPHTPHSTKLKQCKALILISIQLTEEDMFFPENSCQGFHKGLPFEAIGGLLEDSGVCWELE
jgi:hypothetical protein